MHLHLHSLLLSLRSDSNSIKKQWRILFDFELAQNTARLESMKPEIVLEAVVVSSLPPSPSFPPVYATIDPPLAVYFDPEQGLLLRLSNKAQIQFTLADLEAQADSDPINAHILVTDKALSDGSFEDITTFALAPLLRRRGLFMIHAFTAALNKKAIMFVGPSGSGKTSSGMSFAVAGWQLLANDVALMRQDDMPLALLSPGTVHVSPYTFTMFPNFSHLSGKYSQETGTMKVAIPRLGFLQDEPILLSAPIKAVYFPIISNKEKHESEAVPRGVGLARLMESSMDQWDQDTWEEHIGFLERLSREVSFFSLRLGSDMSSLPAFLERDLAGV